MNCLTFLLRLDYILHLFRCPTISISLEIYNTRFHISMCFL
nr:MAG TPA: hypothetical protein [Caudoviricetes sp.]